MAPQGASAAKSDGHSAHAAQCKAAPGAPDHEISLVTPGSLADSDGEIVSPLENLTDSQSVATQGDDQYESSAEECSTDGQDPDLKSYELKGSEPEGADLFPGGVISAGNVSVETVLVDDYGSESDINSVSDEPLLTAAMAGTAGDEPADVRAQGHSDEAEAEAAAEAETKAVRPVRRSRSRKLQPANAPAADGDMTAGADADTDNDALTAGSELEALKVTDKPLSTGSSAAAVALQPVRKVRRSRKSDKAPAA